MRILFVCARNPWPPRRGDQLRAVQFLEALRGRHELVVLVPRDRARSTENSAGSPSDWKGIELESYRRGAGDRVVGLARALLGGDSLQSALFYSADLGRRLRRLAPGCDLAIVQLVRLSGHLDDLGSLPVFVDLIDSLSLSFERRANWDRRWTRSWLRPLWGWESRRLLRAERRTLARVAGAAVVCERDRQHLAGRLGGSLAQRLKVVPLVCPRPIPETAGGRGRSILAGGAAAAVGRRPTLLLSGNLGYFPNYHGAEWFLSCVWPQLRHRRALDLVLAGARPGPRLRRLARRHGVVVKDTPADLFAEILNSDIALAPLFAGAGIPVKVLEAWAAEVPVVASEWAARGVGAISGDQLLVAGKAEEWIVAIERLLDSHELRQRVIGQGIERLHREHTPEVLGRRLDSWMTDGLKRS